LFSSGFCEQVQRDFDQTFNVRLGRLITVMAHRRWREWLAAGRIRNEAKSAGGECLCEN